MRARVPGSSRFQPVPGNVDQGKRTPRFQVPDPLRVGTVTAGPECPRKQARNTVPGSGTGGSTVPTTSTAKNGLHRLDGSERFPRPLQPSPSVAIQGQS
jgi:hypothetical protein